ncbi:hypothetical protein SKAU_G00095150 [Synaphobranchus kaupii]|uniref:ribonuclease H n=1 Tax=Synaphobranchus kaupii TaxID=118154 RepID=A0A9Q1FY03_SYNKA|nr:hypothetical protein SKAU_G00095150 [Synaphobranchus kaupii]
MAFQIESAAACAAKLATSQKHAPPPAQESVQPQQSDSSIATESVGYNSCSSHVRNHGSAVETAAPSPMPFELRTALLVAKCPLASLLDTSGSAILVSSPCVVSSPWHQAWPALFSGLGCLTAVTHQPLLDAAVTPVIQPPRRIPQALRDVVSSELQRLLKDGIIEPVDASPWVSKIVTAKKKSGSLRVCIDLCAANKAVIPDRYLLPTSEELTAQFYGSTHFLKLDLCQGYLQVPLYPKSRDLTAFVTHSGVFRYTQMPFGLSSELFSESDGLHPGRDPRGGCLP